MKHQIRDIALSASGIMKIEWVKKNMPLLQRLEDEFVKTKPFAGKKITVSVHLEAKTARLALLLAAGGAEVCVTGSNSLSTQDDVAAGLVASGISVFAWYDATPEEYNRHIEMSLEFAPDLIIDDGGDLINLLHTKRQDLMVNVIGGCEETTTGIIRLKAMEAEGLLKFPMMAVNNAYCKYLFDNRYGTGQSVWDGINRTTNLIVAGKDVVVVGYGWCGKGIAMRAKGLGASVIVCEIDPVKAAEAVMDGYKVMPMSEAAKRGDIFVTVTGCSDVITKEHFAVMKDGVLLSNAGHFNCEVSVTDLVAVATEIKDFRQNIKGYKMPQGHWVFLLAEGKLVNLASGDGHPAEIMDMSFAIQALSAEYVAKHGKDLKNQVIDIPADIDKRVAMMKLDAWGIAIDRLTPTQEKYLSSWNA